MDQMTEHRRWLIASVYVPLACFVGGAIVALVVGAIPVALWMADQKQKHAQQIREAQAAARAAALAEAAAIPRLQFLSGRFDEKGNSVLTAQNSSQTRHAAIDEVRFTITDAPQLQRLRRVYPPPRDDGGVGAANNVDNVFFRQGAWRGRDAYCYAARVGLNVPPGPPTDLALAIIDPKLAGGTFSGELEIFYSKGEPGIRTHASVPKVTIKARAKE
jgi:hypothetical protein